MPITDLAVMYRFDPDTTRAEIVRAFTSAPHGRGAAELLGVSYQTLMRIVHSDAAIAKAVLAVRLEKRTRGFGQRQQESLESYT